jgi:hypothetical protein
VVGIARKVAHQASKPAFAGGAAVAALAGSVAAGKALKPKRRTMNVGPVAWPKVRIKAPKMPDMDAVANGVSKAGQQVGRTGERLGKIATDIQKAGETTERVGKLLSK